MYTLQSRKVLSGAPQTVPERRLLKTNRKDELPRIRQKCGHKTSSCHGSYPRENKLNPLRALWHNQYRHRAPGSVKFRTGGHSPRTALASRQNRTNLRIRTGCQDSAREAPRKRGRTGENPVPTVQSGWKVARAEKGRSALRRTSRKPGLRAGFTEAVT